LHGHPGLAERVSRAGGPAHGLEGRRPARRHRNGRTDRARALHPRAPPRQHRPGSLRDQTYLSPRGEGAAVGPVTSPTVVVSAKGAARWRDGHPWIYRSDVEPARLPPGIVSVADKRHRFLGQALWSPRSEISLRWLTPAST